VVAEKYTVYVDISAKLEAWEKDSVIAVANGYTRTLRITSEIKTKVVARLQTSQPVQFYLMALCTYIAIAIKPDLPKVRRIVLDRDYSGEVAQRLIIRYLIELIRRDAPHFKAAHIRIDNVAGSTADRLARAVYQGEQTVDGVITMEMFEAVLGQ